MFAKFMSIAPKLGGFVLGDSFGILPGNGDLGKTSEQQVLHAVGYRNNLSLGWLAFRPAWQMAT